MQFNTVLMLLVAISRTYSSSPCERSVQGWSGGGAAGTHSTSAGEASAFMFGKDLVEEKWADVREAESAGQEEEEWGWRRRRKNELKRKEVKGRGEERRGVGSAMWVKWNLCWCIVGSIGGTPEVPIYSKDGRFRAKQAAGGGWLGFGSWCGWSKRSKDWESLASVQHTHGPLKWMSTISRAYACERVCASMLVSVCVYSGINGAG